MIGPEGAVEEGVEPYATDHRGEPALLLYDRYQGTCVLCKFFFEKSSAFSLQSADQWTDTGAGSTSNLTFPLT
jgi:hypothetical protein